MRLPGYVAEDVDAGLTCLYYFAYGNYAPFAVYKVNGDFTTV